MRKCNITHIEKCINWPALKMRQLRAILKATMTCMRKAFVELDVDRGFAKRNHTEVFCMVRGTWKANMMNKSHQTVKIFGLRCD